MPDISSQSTHPSQSQPSPQPQSDTTNPRSAGEPMVTVKKADGTTVKMSLTELKALKSAKAANQENKKKTEEQESDSQQTTDSGRTSVNQTSDDNQNITVDRRPSTVDQAGPKTLKEGLEKLLKEKPELNPVNSQQSADYRRPSTVDRRPSTVDRSSPSWDEDDHKSLLHDDLHVDDINAENEARMKALSKVRGVAPALPSMKPKEIDWDAIKPVESLSKLKTQSPPVSDSKSVRSPVKQPMHDVRPAPVSTAPTVGPVDELRQFSLNDMRRLAASPDAAKSKIIQKFDTLKQESYLLYMDALGAWRQSPLYTRYQHLIAEALQNHRTIDQQLSQPGSDGQKMGKDEFIAIVGVSKSLV